MRTCRRVACSATLMLLVALAAASASDASRGIQLSQSRITASGRLTMAGNSVCDVSITATTNSVTLLKQTGVTQFTLTAGSGTCTGPIGSATLTLLTPWNGRYVSFRGTLPNITGINVMYTNAGWRGTYALIGSCLWGGALTGVTWNVSGGTWVSVTYNSSPVPLVSGTAFCPSTDIRSGTLTVVSPIPTVTLV